MSKGVDAIIATTTVQCCRLELPDGVSRIYSALSELISLEAGSKSWTVPDSVSGKTERHQTVTLTTKGQSDATVETDMRRLQS